MNKNFKTFLKENPSKVILWDGAMGTMLISKGLRAGKPPEILNIENPSIVEEIHREYILAGSLVILTNSFGGNRIRLQKQNIESKILEINKMAVKIARNIAGREIFVAGDIGPTGEFAIENEGKIKENFYEQANLLLNEGVDLLLIETMLNLKEAILAVEGCKRINGSFVGVSITFKKTKRGFFTEYGNSVEECVKALENTGADMIGSNCNLMPVEMAEVSEIISALAKLPVIIQPNAGIPEIINGIIVYKKDPHEFAKECEKILKNRIRAIGGCCGTTPLHIKKIKEILNINES